MRKARAPRPAAQAKPAATDGPEPLAERLWVRALMAAWIIGIVAYYLRLQLAKFLAVVFPR